MRHYFGSLADRDRTERSDYHLAFLLTFIAGAANAGGFMAIRIYTSHMSGMVSSLADNLVIGNLKLFAYGLAGLLAFLAGAATSAILINWARRRDLHSQYALPLGLEAILLAAFAATSLLDEGSLLRGTAAVVSLLCYVMGLQNAMITKLSGARIRTTHVTGMVTDIGIECGKWFYSLMPHDETRLPAIAPERKKLATLVSLVGLFFCGGVFGALLFGHYGVSASLVLAVPLMLVAAFPFVHDVDSLFVHKR